MSDQGRIRAKLADHRARLAARRAKLSSEQQAELSKVIGDHPAGPKT